jgi:hypothetical protein
MLCGAIINSDPIVSPMDCLIKHMINVSQPYCYSSVNQSINRSLGRTGIHGSRGITDLSCLTHGKMTKGGTEKTRMLLHPNLSWQDVRSTLGEWLLYYCCT